MMVTLNRNDDYDAISNAVTKEVQKYISQNGVRDNQAIIPSISKEFILLTREKANGYLADVDPQYHLTAEMITYPDAYDQVDFSQLTGEEKFGGGYQYHNLILYDKLTTGWQKQLYYEVLPFDVQTYFENNNLFDFKIRDSVQRTLYQERYFLYKKNGNVADILASTREMFIKKPPQQFPKGEVQIPFINVQSTILSNTLSLPSFKLIQFPPCGICRPKFPQTAKHRSLLGRLAFALAQQIEERIRLFKQYRFERDVKKASQPTQLIDTSQFLLNEELTPIEEIYQFIQKPLTQTQIQSSNSDNIQCILPLRLGLDQQGSQILSSKSKKVRIDIAPRDPRFRCTDAALIGGEAYDKIFVSEMEKQKIEIAEEESVLIPVFFVDTTQLKKEKHNINYQQQESINLTHVDDTFVIKIHEGDRTYDVILSILCTRGPIMTTEEAMRLNIWIEDINNETMPIYNVSQDPGVLFKSCAMILIGKESMRKKSETELVVWNHNEDFVDEQNQNIEIIKQDLTIAIDPKSYRNESECFDAFGFKWSILLLQKIEKDYYSRLVEKQGIFLVLKSIDELGDQFSQRFQFNIQILQEEQDPVEINIDHTFTKRDPDLGSWQKLKPQQLKEGNGFVKNGKLQVKVSLHK